ncbi:nuclear transport factor 2 family protein [Acaryochloris sp. IP29b_bin.137]|uniref:nuclear transport factor 2 family protein n=1 Tax=Acaryochloris sp. IP29b_bin.137 TaxID=2969217 RepID=UPI002637B2A5|nr:nuclear transport factor 2 family protein [Acaryochloris sp. IP29b_bin.137]
MNSTRVYASQKQVADRDYSAIFEVLSRYYDGLYRCDPKLLSTVFHPNAQYFTASDGELLHLDMDTYFPIVEQRTSPESSQESYEFSVDSIEFVGPVTAIARMRSSMLSKNYTDLLTLVWLEGGWKIITKVFHFTNHADA